MKIKQEGHHGMVEGECDPSSARVNLLSFSLSDHPLLLVSFPSGKICTAHSSLLTLCLSLFPSFVSFLHLTLFSISL
jgi:hypothetical protein